MGGGVSRSRDGADKLTLLERHIEHDGVTATTLSMIMFNPEAKEAFLTFLREEYSTTNIEFFNGVDDLHSQYAQLAPPDFMRHAKLLLNYGYFSDFEVEPVIKAQMVELFKVEDDFNEEAVMAFLKEIQNCVLHKLRSILPKFERSRTFAGYLHYTDSSFKNEPIEAALLEKQKRMKKRSDVTKKAQEEPVGRNFSGLIRKDVLVVENVSVVAKIIVRTLQPRYNVVLAVTGREALEVLLTKRFDSVLISLELNDKEGIDVMRSFYQMETYLQQLKKRSISDRGPNSQPSLTLVIGMTADKNVEKARAAIKEGFSEVLIKPFGLPEFRKAKGERQRLMSAIGHLLD